MFLSAGPFLLGATFSPLQGGCNDRGWSPTCCMLAVCTDKFILLLSFLGDVCGVCIALVLPHLHHVSLRFVGVCQFLICHLNGLDAQGLSCIF